MKSLSTLLIEGRRSEDFVPPGYRLIQDWTEREWETVWTHLVDGRPEGWKKLPRATVDQLERLAQGNIPDYVRDGLLFYEAPGFVARVQADAERAHCWRLLVAHEQSTRASDETSAGATPGVELLC